MSFNNKTIEELHDLLVSKEISATELTQATLDDIKAREEAVNAFVTVAEEAALAQAKAIDEKGIDADNLLSGIPLAVKDNISTDGILTTAASKMLYNYEPIFDATAVANAKAKDMIVIGKTNMDEFAMGGSGETSYYGATKNAWDHSKVPGGSSSGSAASVASGQVRLSLGSDTGGSIRQPAAFNGIVGLKPTYGTVSRFGLIAFGSSLDQIGTFSPTVKENAQLLNVIASEDAKDSTSAPVRVADFTSKIGQDIKGMKIALPKEYLGEGIDPEVKETILNAAKHFEKLGATVEEVSLPHSKYGVAVYYIIASSEASSNLQRFDGIRYGFRAEDAKNLDDIYVNTRSQGFGDEVKRRIMLGTFSLSSGYYDAYYKKAGQVRTLIIQDFEKVFADYDLILGPTAPSVAFDLDSLNHDPVAMYLADLLTIPVNLAGLPGISIPAGFAQGLPVGLQLIGPKYSEETIYQAAAAFEATTDYHKQQPLIFGDWSFPGVLPVLNKGVVDAGIKAALALNMDIHQHMHFDRKNYFYPDNPKAYQISQFDEPIGYNGWIEVQLEDGSTKKIGIERAHLEEDAGKNTHGTDGFSYVDLNRQGVPLIEIVSEADMRSPEEAYAYLTALKEVIQYTGISDVKMEEGSMRVDANISLRPYGQEEFGTKTELKNLNSFSNVRKGLEYEVQRQAKILRSGGVIRQETRRYDEANKSTILMRVKEGAADYRYFPEPDLPLFEISDEWIEEMRTELPEFPKDRRARYVAELGLSDYDANQLTATKVTSDFFEAAVALGGDAKQVSNWLQGEVAQFLNAEGKTLEEIQLTPENLVEMIAIIEDGTISSKIAKKVFVHLAKNGGGAREYVEKAGLVQISDPEVLIPIIHQVFADNEAAVADFKSGKRNADKAFTGFLMKATKGQANPQVALKLLAQELAKLKEDK